MMYQQKTFSVPASAGTKAECDRVGHAWADAKGKCVRCAEQIRDVGFNSSEGEE